MKKIFLFFCLLSALLFTSCDNYKNYELDGMWQLKTIEDVEKNIIEVDTVYYSFQRGEIFSFTQIPDFANNPIYGYIDFPSDNQVHVQIDKQFAWIDFISLSGWSSTDVVFDIKKYDKTNLVLSENGKTYTFKKF